MTLQTASEFLQFTADEEEHHYQAFLEAYPEYRTTHPLDAWRATEYRRLDARKQTYLDYTGGSLYAQSQLDAHFELLRTHVLGNPHSINPTSLAATELVEDTRAAVLDFFHADPEEYFLVFTPNASGALKLVGESYPFTPDGRYLLTFDNHNSVNGIREFARRAGAPITYVPLVPPDLRLDETTLKDELRRPGKGTNNLFAFPAQSNFSGVKHPLEFVSLAQSNGWDVMLDAAAFVPTSRLDLSTVKPEFISLSFYKMFGYPTGIGALIIKRKAYQKLVRPWFAGGTVNFVSVQADGHVLSPFEAAFEEGTVNYLGIPAVKIGLEHLEKVGMDVIGTRVKCLTGWLIDQLLALRHSNGKPMVRLYGPADTTDRGGTIAMNFYDDQERLLDYRRIEELATDKGISLRTGCFCNPGAGEIAEGLTVEDMRTGLAESERINLPRFVELIKHKSHKSAGAIRISVGLATNFADAYRWMRFAASFRDQTNLHIGDVKFNISGCRTIRDSA